MSTLKVNNIKDTSGGTSNLKIDGAAKAWLNLNGSGTIAIRDSFNVSSVSDSGTGIYVVTMANAMANTNYAVVSGGEHKSGVYFAFPAVRNRDQVTRSTTQFQIECGNNGIANLDMEEVHVAVFGD